MDSEIGDGYYSGSPSMTPNSADKHPETGPDDAGVTPRPIAALDALNTDDEEYGERQQEYWDNDSAIDNDSLIGDDTKSLASYITDYRFEHGRRYHAYKDGAYWVWSDAASMLFNH